MRRLQRAAIRIQEGARWTPLTQAVDSEQELRAPLIALRAFNVELTQIPDNVRQEHLMQIRMQWWRDAVKSAYTNKPQPNPVIQALHAVHLSPHASHLRVSIYTPACRWLQSAPCL